MPLKLPNKRTSAPSPASPAASPPVKPGKSDEAYLSFGYDAIAAVVHKSLAKGLSHYDPAKPENHAKISDNADITTMSPQQVGQLHQFFVGLHSYMLVQLARADMDLIAAENAHDAAKKAFIVRNRQKQVKWELDAELAEDPGLRKSRMLVIEKQALKEMLSAITKGTDNKANLFSREITRRAAEKESR